MKDVEFSCMQKVMISSGTYQLRVLLSARHFLADIFFGGKLSSGATQYHAIFLSKTIQLVQSQREDS